MVAAAGGRRLLGPLVEAHPERTGPAHPGGRHRLPRYFGGRRPRQPRKVLRVTTRDFVFPDCLVFVVPHLVVLEVAESYGVAESGPSRG